MQQKTMKPRSFIFYYCAICVLIGCVETAMNQKMFEQNHPPIKPLRIITIKPVPKVVVQPAPQQSKWDDCPDKENVAAAIQECNKLISDTQKLIFAFQNDGDAEETKLQGKLALWKKESAVFKTEIETRLYSCDLLLGATGVLVHPELPPALGNLKRAGQWLELSVASAQEGNLIDAVDYIAYARKATKQAGNLVNGKARPMSCSAMVKLPKRLQLVLVSRSPG